MRINLCLTPSKAKQRSSSSRPIPNALVRDGKIVRDSLVAPLHRVSTIAGHGGRIEGVYIEVNGGFAPMLKYAQLRVIENNNPRRKRYDILNHSCVHFAKDVVAAAGIETPWMLDPRPNSYIGEFRDDYPGSRLQSTDSPIDPRIGRGSAMNAAFRRWLAFAVVVQVALTGCDFVKIGSSSQGPARPSGVPDEAVWAGGVDGGNFLTMSPVRNDGTYLLKVYHDYTGDLEFEGAVKFDGTGGGSIAVIDGSTFNSWDGRRLSLMDGRTLSPVKK